MSGQAESQTNGLPDFPTLMLEFEHYQRNRRYLSEQTIRVRRTVVGSMFRRMNQHPVTTSTNDLELALDVQQLQATSRRHYIQHLSAFYEFLILEGYCVSNPAKALTRPKEGKRLPRPISEADLAKVLLYVGWRRPLRTWVLLGAYAGLRRAEIAELTYEAVDLTNQELRIRGKGNKERTVPLHPLIVDELGFYLYDGATGRIFQESRDTLGVALGRALRRAGVDATPHQLRHRFATQLYRNTEDIALVSVLLGHDNLNTTMIYTQVGTDRAKRAVVNL